MVDDNAGGSSAIVALMEAPILPVLTFEREDDAVAIAQALFDGGVRAVEITLRTDAGLRSIERVATQTGLVVGAGTVLRMEQVRQVADAGAQFAVSPGLDRAVVDAARDAGLGIIPGIATPTEALEAMRLGLDRVKVFPAALLGGPRYLRQLHAPLPDLRFVPSGGITMEAAADYLAVPNVTAASGSWMVPSEAAARRDYGTITRLTKDTFRRL
jgi:2-dehydro-3-deoxyphosphogluconate aldolase/(4S)-4-hydroxy-2-oxoglutarate aldolase